MTPVDEAMLKQRIVNVSLPPTALRFQLSEADPGLLECTIEEPNACAWRSIEEHPFHTG